VSTASYTSAARAVGAAVEVPKLATPEMVTAGPIRSLLVYMLCTLRSRRWPFAIALSLLTATPATAQDPHAGHGSTPPAAAWSWDAKVFAGSNYQRRAFTDFHRPQAGGHLFAV
jgi:hypothetical protein